MTFFKKRQIIVLSGMIACAVIWLYFFWDINDRLKNPIPVAYSAKETFEYYGLEVKVAEKQFLTYQQMLDLNLNIDSSLDLIDTTGNFNYLIVQLNVNNPSSKQIYAPNMDACGIEIDSYGNGMDSLIAQGFTNNSYLFEPQTDSKITLVFTVPTSYGKNVLENRDVKIILSYYPYYKYIEL